MQAFCHDRAQKIVCSNLRKCFVEMNNDGLLNAEHTQRFNFLIESLEQRRRRLWMQHRARMWLKGEHSRRRFHRARPFHDSSDDGLMAEVQTIEDAKRQDSRTSDVSVLCAME